MRTRPQHYIKKCCAASSCKDTIWTPTLWRLALNLWMWHMGQALNLLGSSPSALLLPRYFTMTPRLRSAYKVSNH